MTLSPTANAPAAPGHSVDNKINCYSRCRRCGNKFLGSVLACPEDGTLLMAAEQVVEAINDSYEFLSVIGHGGMGLVLKAVHRETGVQVAIKLLLENGNATAIKRFNLEAETVSRLRHPNIVALREAGSTAAGYPFIVMELIDGVTLADFLKSRGHLEESEAIELFLQLCSAMSCAHKNGILHRDLKLNNLLISKDASSKLILKVVDFGIAKEFDIGIGFQRTALTHVGELIGSPLYMSPEQALGRSMDARSDIYSAGCVLFHMLTGAPPFVGDSAVATIFLHANAQPSTLKEASLGKEFNPAIESIVASMLAKNAKDRPESFEQVAESLRKLQNAHFSFEQTRSVKLESKHFDTIADQRFLFRILHSRPLAWTAALCVPLFLILVGVVSNQTTLNNIKVPVNFTTSSSPSPLLQQRQDRSISQTGKTSSNRMDEDSTNYLALQAAQSVNLAEIEIRDQLNDGKDKITLTDAVLGDDSLDVLFKLLAQKRCVIHSLDLGNSNVSDDGLRKLVGMHLSELLLGESRRLTGNSIQSIVRAGPLKRLCINGMRQVYGDELMELCKLRSSLEVLELENLNLQVSDLTFLTRMKKLRCLSLRSNKGSDDKLTEFVCGLKNIINLNIAGAPVTNKVIKKIVKMPNLRFFGIENTLIDDEGIAALAPAHIELLEIGGLAGRVTDRSMKLLAKFKHLHKLIVHKSKWITDKGMNEFRESVRDRVLVIEIP